MVLRATDNPARQLGRRRCAGRRGFDAEHGRGMEKIGFRRFPLPSRRERTNVILRRSAKITATSVRARVDRVVPIQDGTCGRGCRGRPFRGLFDSSLVERLGDGDHADGPG